MDNPYEKLQPKSFTLLAEQQINDINHKGIMGKNLFIKTCINNMYDYIYEFYFDLFTNHIDIFYFMTVYDNGNENIIDKKLRDIITNIFIQSYLHIVNNNLLDKNIFNQSLINKTIKIIFCRYRLLCTDFFSDSFKKIFLAAKIKR